MKAEIAPGRWLHSIVSWRLIAGMLLCLVAAPLAFHAQATKESGPSAAAAVRKPFSKSEILELLKLGTPEPLLIRRIKAVGINFDPSDGEVDDLARAGASTDTIAAIREAGRAMTARMTPEEMEQQGDSLVRQGRISEAHPYFQKACDRGNSEACSHLSPSQDAGQSIANDAAHKEPANPGGCAADPETCGNLGVMYRGGKGGVRVNNSRAVALFSEACDAGNATSCVNLAEMYEFGRGVPIDAGLAAQFFQKSCLLRNQSTCARATAPGNSQTAGIAVSQVNYEAGMRDFLAGDYAAAATEFRNVLQDATHDDRLRGNAQFYLGEIAYWQQRYSEAIDAYDALLRAFAGSAKAPAAEMHKGLALLQLNRKADAIDAFRFVIQSFPQAPEAVQARLKLESFGIGTAGSVKQPLASAGKIHGRVINPTGAPQSGGVVSLSTDSVRNPLYSFPVSASGDFEGEAEPGIYTLVFRLPDTPPDKTVDSIQGIRIVAGGDALQDVDMSRPEFIAQLSSQQRASLDNLRQHNAEAMQKNDVIRGLNADLRTVNQDLRDAEGARAAATQYLGSAASKADLDAREAEIKNEKYTEVETLMLKDTVAKPDSSVLWAQLGQAQIGLRQFTDAEVTYKKAIELEAASNRPNPQIQGVALSGLGEVYARAGRVQEADAAYDAAARINPSLAAFYFKNEAVVFYQMRITDAQVASANKSILADPNQPLLYFLKAEGLVQKATLNPKTKKIVLPPDCLDAYRKYLELAPGGPYAAEVRSILDRVK